MDFLTTLYSNDNFGIILFITISILVLAFLVILFFGKKDQKERELAATKSVELNNGIGQFAFQDNQPKMMMDIPVPPNSSPTPSIAPPIKPMPMNQTVQAPPINPINNGAFVKEPPMFSNSQNTVPPVLNSVPPKPMEEKIQPNYQAVPNTPSTPPVYRSTVNQPNMNSGIAPTPMRVEKEIQTEKKPPLKTDFDFDALAASISKELKSLEESKPFGEPKPLGNPKPLGEPKSNLEKAPNLDETIRIPTFELSNLPQNRGPVPPIRTEVERRNDLNARPTMETVRIEPEKKPMSGPTQFSSVFVSKKEPNSNQFSNSIPINQEMQQSKTETNSNNMESIKTATPVKPNIELPKTIDLPKLNGNSNAQEINTQNNAPKIVFSGLENDIPTYNRNSENRM